MPAAELVAKAFRSGVHGPRGVAADSRVHIPGTKASAHANVPSRENEVTRTGAARPAKAPRSAPIRTSSDRLCLTLSIFTKMSREGNTPDKAQQCRQDLCPAKNSKWP